MAQRITYRRRCSYNTRSNKIRKVKTPGGKIAAQYVKKVVVNQKCTEPGCGALLNGIANVRASALSTMSRRQKTVSRTYGGHICHHCVRTRIVRSFLSEEVRIIKRSLMNKPKSDKKKKRSQKK
ncbi:hypothetical protein IMG5_146300 [Ichthyophthirius multifiliis]|uniref:60S ribosomal protein L34 n=1 Tax=Ichthyophthirius multifiliis TaxID=5932 RepID=G0QXZ8_ICHMU|nr:hypothetical protein IMG5_146300 [Ichthyophthirius multifiliis]EGR29912.1 hypothetical protein IMG5_146300 [Ichthyophthirius multifiliis]|eukprot:XP_004031148.1 hypothetical protein IMG5_146300 [Ichthyophthirius multifiliis]